MGRVVAVLAAVAAAVALIGAGATHAQSPAPLMAGVFGDHAVLQRDRPISVWGRAAPGETVTVSIAGHSVHAQADAGGSWRARLSPLPAGGPHTLIAQAGPRTQVASDVLIGDVWLCSGQSNMVLPVSRALNSPREIASSADDGIRLVTVQTDNRPTVQDEFVRPVTWAAAGPQTVAEFSAACFFFAQDLRRDHAVPMGLINDAWGGSTIQAWMSEPAVRALGGYDDGLSILAQYPNEPEIAQARWGRLWETWWRGKAGDAPWSDPATDWPRVPQMTAWETWGVPQLAAYNGMVWYRTEVTLTAAQAAQGATLTLGNVDEADQTWVNGRPVGASGAGDRVYPLPKGLLKAGINSVTLNVLDTYANGGLYGPPEKRAIRLADGTAIPLDAGGWRYRIAPGPYGPPPRSPWEALAGLTTISNAMVAPLGDYGLKGALWYQGESNAEREPEKYDAQMAGLMADWRRRFDNPQLPFLIVSLANYGTPPTKPENSGWAELRDRQRLAARADPHAALVVAVDLGDKWDIHPGQKLELGRRLARAARHVVYGEAIAPSGPEAVSARRDGDSIIVAFEGVTGGLATYSSDRAIGFELCDAAGAGCRYVDARPEGSSVRLAAGAGSAGQVRFCWADSPVCNLFDGAGLPAGPFRLGVP